MASIVSEAALLREYLRAPDGVGYGISSDLQAVMMGFDKMRAALAALAVKSACRCACCRATEAYVGIVLNELNEEISDKASHT